MECTIPSERLVCCLDVKKYVHFCKMLNKEIEGKTDLKVFQHKDFYNKITDICAGIFNDEIDQISSCTSDPFIGIAALDVPESNLFDKKENNVFGAAVSMGIFGAIGEPNIDSINKMPFTIYSASHENAKLLDSKEFSQYPPEVKLGFHNDGLFRDKKINIPLHIMVYNMYINYRHPGNFKWVPFASWGEVEKYVDLLKERIVKIRITPDFYFDNAGNIKNTLIDMVEVPICQVKDGDVLFFLNGKVLSEDNDFETVKLVDSMRDSISNNHFKILIQQKERRAFYLKNDNGFHARDIFEKPIEDSDLTRVFIRAVDVNAKSYSSY